MALKVTLTATRNGVSLSARRPTVLISPAVPGIKGDTGPQGPQGEQGVPGVGVPPGGAQYYVLGKVDAADHNTTWMASIQSFLLGNPGYIITVDADGNIIALPPGTEGQVPTVQADGTLAYATPAAGGGGPYTHINDYSFIGATAIEFPLPSADYDKFFIEVLNLVPGDNWYSKLFMYLSVDDGATWSPVSVIGIWMYAGYAQEVIVSLKDTSYADISFSNNGINGDTATKKGYAANLYISNPSDIYPGSNAFWWVDGAQYWHYNVLPSGGWYRGAVTNPGKVNRIKFFLYNEAIGCVDGTFRVWGMSK
jgi:hypothetical protein